MKWTLGRNCGQEGETEPWLRICEAFTSHKNSSICHITLHHVVCVCFSDCVELHGGLCVFQWLCVWVGEVYVCVCVSVAGCVGGGHVCVSLAGCNGWCVCVCVFVLIIPND